MALVDHSPALESSEALRRIQDSKTAELTSFSLVIGCLAVDLRSACTERSSESRVLSAIVRHPHGAVETNLSIDPVIAITLHET